MPHMQIGSLKTHTQMASNRRAVRDHLLSDQVVRTAQGQSCRVPATRPAGREPARQVQYERLTEFSGLGYCIV